MTNETEPISAEESVEVSELYILYPNEYVAVKGTDISQDGTIISGTVLAHTNNPLESLAKVMESVKEGNYAVLIHAVETLP